MQEVQVQMYLLAADARGRWYRCCNRGGTAKVRIAIFTFHRALGQAAQCEARRSDPYVWPLERRGFAFKSTKSCLGLVGAQWDEGNMVHAMKRFGGTTVGWRFGDG